MTLYASVWLCVTLYDSLRLWMTLDDSGWLCIISYDSVWICMTLHDSVRLSMTLMLTPYDSTWIFMTLFIQLDSLWLSMTCMSMVQFDLAWAFMNLSYSVRLCITLRYFFGSIWLSITLFITGGKIRKASNTLKMMKNLKNQTEKITKDSKNLNNDSFFFCFQIKS